MPKFISSSSGQVYAKDKHKEEEDEILASIHKQQDESQGTRKPAAVNKKGTREKPKSSLELFKEELQRLNEEREKQRDKLKSSISNTPAQQPVPIPLKPDPRCPTTLTLQVNLNPRAKDTPSSGSYDTGDPTTTNLYIGNLNPTVTESDLCDVFGKFGPLASIKIMWPRTDEERARNRNSGFVAYMSRVDCERAIKVVNGMDYKGYEMKLGWGKAVPLPKNPVFIPEELIELFKPPQRSGLPLNAQLSTCDVERGYQVPSPLPQQVPQDLVSQVGVDSDVTAIYAAYNEFKEVFCRATVHVCVPQDRKLLDKIHKTIEYVIREGPVFESIIMARELQNNEFKFLYDYDSPEHVYYRWKLYSILHGDDPYAWSTSEFRMYTDGPVWKPPPINPYAEGMPLGLVEKLTGLDREIITGNKPSCRKLKTLSNGSLCVGATNFPEKGKLNPVESDTFTEMLKSIDPSKTKVGSAMLFCIDHSDSAEEIIARIAESFSSPEAKYKQLIGLAFLISDILHNSSATVTNASFYRQGFKDKLTEVFQSLKRYLSSIEEEHQADRFKKKVVSVLGSWKYYQLYEDDFVLQLSKLLYGKLDELDDPTDDSQIGATKECSKQLEPELKGTCIDEDLDGKPIDDSILAECLEIKGMSLRWYRTLELSDEECDELDDMRSPSEGNASYCTKRNFTDNVSKERFKVSKWEVVTKEPEPASPLLNASMPTTLVTDSGPKLKSERSDSPCLEQGKQ